MFEHTTEQRWTFLMHCYWWQDYSYKRRRLSTKNIRRFTSNYFHLAFYSTIFTLHFNFSTHIFYVLFFKTCSAFSVRKSFCWIPVSNSLSESRSTLKNMLSYMCSVFLTAVLLIYSAVGLTVNHSKFSKWRKKIEVNLSVYNLK